MPTPRATLHLALTATLSAALAAACSGGSDKAGAGGSSSSAGGAADAGSDAPATVTLRLDPTSATVTVPLGTTPAPLTFHAYATIGGAAEQDVTDMASWSVGAAVAQIGNGVAVLTGNGGQTTVVATFEGATAEAPLTVEVTGDVFGAGTDPTTKTGFDNGTPDPTPSAAPSIEYPEDGVVLPANLPPVDAQWTQGDPSDAAYRIHVTCPSILDVTFYTTALDLTFPQAPWATIAATVADVPAQITVDALGGGMVRTSLPHTLTVTSDTIDDTAIYVWQSSTGTFQVLDMIAGTEVPLPNSAAALAAGQPCSGCHRISRDGQRFAYTYNGANFEFGAMTYDATTALYTPTITPSAGFRATYASFNPNEATQVPAMLLTVPDNVAQNTAGTVRLQLVDPDTGMPVMSNLAQSLAMIDPAVGAATSMPDWSPDGSFAVFAAYDSTQNFVRELGDDIVAASLVEVPISYDAASGFTFGAPKTLVQVPAGTAAMPDTGQNNFLPTISPDGSAVAFTRAAGWWSIKTQTSLLNLSGQIAVVRRSDGQVLELVNGSNGPGTTQSSTWPQWAPSLGKRYAWLAYAAERPYGHLLTAASPENTMCGFVQGQQICKHLWVTAIDLGKLASGTADPSSAPFFIPGQTLAAQYVSPQWTKAVIMAPQ
jgi:WD40-like Beta Propeller Repeat